MSIFKKMASALGFSGDDDEIESQPYTAENITNACVPEVEKPQPVNEVRQQAQPVAVKEDDQQLPNSLLDVIVEMLNRSLPDYVVASLDKEAEKKYLYQQLGTPFKKFIEEANNNARTQITQKWKTEQENLKKEVEAARAKLKEIEEQRNTMQSAQLSAERQKRAVTEKMHELEARIASMEAEREQFELENKSLVNKLKVANVHQEELDAAREDHTRLMADLNKQRARITELEQQLAQAPQESEAGKQLLLVQQELEQHVATIEQLNRQMQESQAQLAQAQANTTAIAEIEARCQKAEQAVSSKVAEVETLSAQLHKQVSANQELQVRIDQLMVQKAQWEQTQADDKAQNTQAIENLKNELEQANTMLSALRNQRQELLVQIETLKQQPAPAPVVEKPAVKPERKVEKKVEKKPIVQESAGISFVKPEAPKPVEPQHLETPQETLPEADFGGFDDFDDDNWLIPTRPDTPEQIAKRKEEERRKQEEERLATEQKKVQQVDPSQMSLW